LVNWTAPAAVIVTEFGAVNACTAPEPALYLPIRREEELLVITLYVEEFK